MPSPYSKVVERLLVPRRPSYTALCTALDGPAMVTLGERSVVVLPTQSLGQGETASHQACDHRAAPRPALPPARSQNTAGSPERPLGPECGNPIPSRNGPPFIAARRKIANYSKGAGLRE